MTILLSAVANKAGSQFVVSRKGRCSMILCCGIAVRWTAICCFARDVDRSLISHLVLPVDITSTRQMTPTLILPVALLQIGLRMREEEMRSPVGRHDIQSFTLPL